MSLGDTAVANYLFRLETSDMPSKAIEEVTTPRWKPLPQDRLLFFKRQGATCLFLGSSTISKVERDSAVPRDEAGAPEFEKVREPGRSAPLQGLVEVPPPSWTKITMTISEPQPLKDTPSLQDFIYSLEKVANFERPGSSIRHHGPISDRDVEAIASGSIHMYRTLYFGVLRYLPQERREELALSARLRSLTGEPTELPVEIGTGRGDASTAKAVSTTPVGQLSHLLEALLLSPAMLAAEVNKAWPPELLDRAGVAFERTSPVQDSSWDTAELQRLASSGHHAELLNLWSEYSRMIHEVQSEEEEIAQWRSQEL